MTSGRKAAAETERICVRLLGEIEVSRGGEALPLPPSKKTRALLAYLALTGRPQRRERLVSLFWDIPDDPRGALRWSLSKLRAVLDAPDRPCVRADRDAVSLDPAHVWVDLPELRARLAGGDAALSTEALAEAAAMFRGELLEGLDLPNCEGYQAWCVAEREEARRLHAAVLAALTQRLAETPERALAYARDRARIDPFNAAARAGLVRLLAAAGRRAEAEEQLAAGERAFAALGEAPPAELAAAGAELAAQPPTAALPLAEPAAPAEALVQPRRAPFVGRARERRLLTRLLDEVQQHRAERIVLVTGEPGVGKTRLLAELMDEARACGGTVLDGGAYEPESDQPYGPWIDALRRLAPVAVGQALGAALAPLLPELGAAPETPSSRERLFGAVVELIAARTHSAPPVLVVLDDVQWCDSASAALLHYVARMNRHRPVLLALAARDGELPDNAAMTRALQSLRRERALEEVALAGLSREETAALLHAVAPRLDAERAFGDSAGNPLFALEIARAGGGRRRDVPASLAEMVRDRIARLPPAAGEVMRWAAALGHVVAVERLEKLVSLDLETLIAALETLERHALIRAEAGSRDGGAYTFLHDVVRRSVYSGLSEPRRRLMHGRIARTLDEDGTADGALASEIAYHAGLAGDADRAARACVAAGRRCLALFANDEAYALARKGARYAETLAEPARVRLLLELAQIRCNARTPAETEAAVAEIEALAERALDLGCTEHARLGFHLISYLRWEGGDWNDAERSMKRAEAASRGGDERDRAVAMAEAARCLCLLERDLGQAEAWLLEAGALASRAGVESAAAHDAAGMLELHRGAREAAAEAFARARDVARREGDRLSEFNALENLVKVEIERGDWRAAERLCAELTAIAERLREGSERPSAQALAALCAGVLRPGSADAALERALEALRLADAKHRLAYALICAAEIDLGQGAAERARNRAALALRLAQALERPSEAALARVAIARAAALAGDEDAVNRQAERLAQARGLSAQARAAIAALRSESAAVARA